MHLPCLSKKLTAHDAAQIKDKTPLSEDEKIAETFNELFRIILKNLNIPMNGEFWFNIFNYARLIVAAIKEYKQLFSILKIKRLIRIKNHFHFKHNDDKK